MAPVLRIGAVITLIIALALGAATALTLANFSRALSDAVESRFQVLAAELRDSIETGLNLGLPLEKLNNVQQIIEERAARDDSIASIEVRDAEGRVLFGADGGASDLAGDARGTVAAPLMNSFGQQVGRVELVYATESYRTTVARVARVLASDAAVLAALAGTIAMLACVLILGPVPRRLARVRAWFEHGRVDGEPQDPLERDAADAVRTANAALRDIDALARDEPDGRREHGS